MEHTIHTTGCTLGAHTGGGGVVDGSHGFLDGGGLEFMGQ